MFEFQKFLACALLVLCAGVPPARSSEPEHRHPTRLTVEVRVHRLGAIKVQAFDDKGYLERQTEFRPLNPGRDRFELLLPAGRKQVLVFFPPHPPRVYPVDLRRHRTLRVAQPTAATRRVCSVVVDVAGRPLPDVEVVVTTEVRPLPLQLSRRGPLDLGYGAEGLIRGGLRRSRVSCFLIRRCSRGENNGTLPPGFRRWISKLGCVPGGRTGRCGTGRLGSTDEDPIELLRRLFPAPIGRGPGWRLARDGRFCAISVTGSNGEFVLELEEAAWVAGLVRFVHRDLLCRRLIDPRRSDSPQIRLPAFSAEGDLLEQAETVAHVLLQRIDDPSARRRIPAWIDGLARDANDSRRASALRKLARQSAELIERRAALGHGQKLERARSLDSLTGIVARALGIWGAMAEAESVQDKAK